MPRKQTIRKAMEDKRAGKSASTQAGEFVREEINKIRHGEHGARSPQQAIASAFPKPAARAWHFRRLAKARQKSARARAPNMPMKQVREGERRGARRALHAP